MRTKQKLERLNKQLAREYLNYLRKEYSLKAAEIRFISKTFYDFLRK